MRVLRWKCEEKGCFRDLCPKLGAFDNCFPGRIGMSDVDGLVEINGRFLFLEWKSEGGSVQTGQRILFERMTELSPRMTVVVVSGDPKAMTVNSVQVFHGGKAAAVEPCDMESLKARLFAWAERAQAASRVVPFRQPA